MLAVAKGKHGFSPCREKTSIEMRLAIMMEDRVEDTSDRNRNHEALDSRGIRIAYSV